MSEILILASGSPRRRELLAWTGLSFEVCLAEIDETPHEFETPAGYVARLAEEKAKYAANGYSCGKMILAADTTVADGEQILGKPLNEGHAKAMLTQLRGRTHQVYTALALFVPGQRKLLVDRCKSDVPMRDFKDHEIDAYVASGDPMDKAGAYGIQNRAFQPVTQFAGCFANVMGLPLCHLKRILKKIDVNPADDLPATCQAMLHYPCPIFSSVLDGQDVG